MSSFGVTATGFVRKTFEDIKAEMEADVKAAFGSETNVAADSVFGQVIGIVSAMTADGWELGEAVYSSQYPNSANDASLDNVSSITGTTRRAASQSSGLITATGVPFTFLTTGRVVSHSVTGDRYVSIEDGALVLASAWVGTTAYAIGDRVTNSANIYVATIAGVSAGAGGPTGTDAAIVDGTVTWRFVGAGTAFVDISFQSEQFGPVPGPSSSLTEIETPVAGWAGAQNLLDVETGLDIETDAEFRIRRLQELFLPGSGTVEAIRADLLNLGDVIDAFVFENVSEFTGSDGKPPHSIECVLRTTTGDTPDAAIDQLIADQIFQSKDAGIETFAFGVPPQFVEKTVLDSQGTGHIIRWTRVDDVEIWSEISITVDPETYPLDGDDQVKAALAAEGNTLSAGQDVIAEKVKCKAFDVDGVVDITAFTIGTAPAPVGTANIPITNRQVAKFDTSRITVTSS